MKWLILLVFSLNLLSIEEDRNHQHFSKFKILKLKFYGKSKLNIFIKTGCLECVQGYCNKLNDNQIPVIVNRLDDTGIRPLAVAASLGHLEIIDYLIARGANKHTKNKLGDSLISMAIKSKNFNMLKILIKTKDDVKREDLNLVFDKLLVKGIMIYINIHKAGVKNYFKKNNFKHSKYFFSKNLNMHIKDKIIYLEDMRDNDLPFDIWFIIFSEESFLNLLKIRHINHYFNNIFNYLILNYKSITDEDKISLLISIDENS